VRTQVDDVLENCIFYISLMYEFSHSQGQTRSCGHVGSMSGLPSESSPGADIGGWLKCAITGREQSQQNDPHSITSSACASGMSSAPVRT